MHAGRYRQTGLLILLKVPRDYKEQDPHASLGGIAEVLADFLGASSQKDAVLKDLCARSGLSFDWQAYVRKPVAVADNEVVIWTFYPVMFKKSKIVTIQEGKELCRLLLGLLFELPGTLYADFVEADVVG